MPTRRELTICFQDTMKMCRTEALSDAVRSSRERTRLIEPLDVLDVPPAPERQTGVTSVSPDRTLEAASRLSRQHPDSKIAVLNFASSVNPGGGVKVGSTAQEESLCRCSTLYPCLDQRRLWEGYYLPNRSRTDLLATDACIYTPDVVVVKRDEPLPTAMPSGEWFATDVITCAAPNLMNPLAEGMLPESELRRIQLTRARRILAVAASKGARILVLGAFGCGAFRNDPRVVASAWREATDELGGWFDVIDFAIWCPPRRPQNYDAFVAAFR